MGGLWPQLQWQQVATIATDQAMHSMVRQELDACQWKDKELVVNDGRSPSTITRIVIHDKGIERIESTKLLGVSIISDLSWDKQVDDIHSKASQRTYFFTLLNTCWDASQQDAESLHRNGPPHYSIRLCSLARGPHQPTVGEAEEHPAKCTEHRNPDLSYRTALSQSGLPRFDQRRESLCMAFKAMLKPGQRLHHLLPHSGTLDTTLGKTSDSHWNWEVQTYHNTIQTASLAMTVTLFHCSRNTISCVFTCTINITLSLLISSWYFSV